MCNPIGKAGQIAPTPAQKLERSRQRSYKLTMSRRKNLKYHKQVVEMIEHLPKNTPQDERSIISSYRSRLVGCASNALYRRMTATPETTFITSHTCNHRLCNVCNMLRSRKLRRKWRAFLQDREQNVHIRKAQCHFFGIDEGDYEKDIYFTSGADIMHSFDMMHLTLTVPHEGGKWCGKQYYARELLSKFNIMRKASWWVNSVFGGEYTVETTNSEGGGLHIHIHALLFVDKRIEQSRNQLSEKILQRWNELTVDKKSSRKKLMDDARVAGIKKSFAFLPENELDNLILKLDGRGSTMVGLKSLYYKISHEQASKFKSKFEQNGNWYAYVTRKSKIDTRLKGVIECLKYHFEPCALEDGSGNLDLPLLKKVLPNIYRQRLYGKFGGFYGVKQLNVLEEPISLDDMREDLQETAGREAFDPRTGLEMSDSMYMYAIADGGAPRYTKGKPVYYLDKKHIKRAITTQEAPTLSAAITYFAYTGMRFEREKEIDDYRIKKRTGNDGGGW